MTRRMEKIEIRNVQEVGEPGGTTVTKDTAALSAVLSNEMSFDAQKETSTRHEHGGAQER